MDRQALLEEKRQRLQQLKQRRAEAASNVASIAPIETLPSPKTPPPVHSISVAIQTDPFVAPYSEPDLPLIVKKETISLEKGVQVTPLQNSESPKLTPLAEITRSVSTESLRYDTAVNEPAVNTLLRESIKQLNAVSYGRRDYSAPTASVSNAGHETACGFLSQCNHGEKNGRPVNALDASLHFPELIVVAYGDPLVPNEATDITPGLAIVYNTSTDPIFPEFFLHAISTITSIVFDKSMSNRVYAGLKNGQLVMYDFSQRTSTKTGLLPSLTTPMYSLTRAMPSKSYKYHSSAIVLILQVAVEGNDLIVLSSGDGVINVWSPNLLAHPRLDLLQLFEPTDQLEMVAIKRPLSIRKMIVHNDLNDSIHAPTKSSHYLNTLIVASNSLHLLQLCSDPKHSYIDWKLACNITDMILLQLSPKMTCIVSANLDWSLLIFIVPQKPIIVPTRSIVLRVAARPHHHKQFVTLGTTSNASQLDLAIEFWDLESRLFSAIMSVPVSRVGINATTIWFDTTGENVLVGFADGYILMWNIDQNRLSHHQPLGVDIDKGIDIYLSKRGISQPI